MKWGILGASGIAEKAVVPALIRAENTEITAVASGSGKGKEFAEKFQIKKVYTDYTELLKDPDVEAVYISVPNHLHKKWTIEAAKHGKHVLCEKPAALNAADAEEMLQICKDNNVQFLEAFMYQFHPQHLQVKDIIQSGEIGDVKLIKAGFSFPLDLGKSNIRLDKEKGGGSLFDVGCYGIHSVLDLSASTPSEIKAVSVVHEELQVDTSTVVSLKMENGILAQIDSSFEQQFRNEYIVIGTKGSVTVTDAYRPDKPGVGTIIIKDMETGDTRTEKLDGDTYRLETEALTEAVTKGRSLEHYHRLTLETLKVIEKCLEEV
ncbi:Gfo/Idh/MocA family protein [Evansella clarkii]|uniref:Gfo/Idh/MocA family protein n=1 Tax=Evansella clarkii TaxID=79879 RepID=UPI000B44C215|nr:Gfo/Idh/MocA family oxidoreductase [Evansella clarkii]